MSSFYAKAGVYTSSHNFFPVGGSSPQLQEPQQWEHISEKEPESSELEINHLL